MHIEKPAQEQSRLEQAQERFLRAVLAESSPHESFAPEQRRAVLAVLSEYFSEWMAQIERSLAHIENRPDAHVYFDAYASWLEHLANVRLARAIQDEVFDTFERPFDEEIALRARLFRAVAMNHADWPSLIQDMEPHERVSPQLLQMVNHLRGFFDRRTVTSHMRDRLRTVGLVDQAGAIAPLPTGSPRLMGGAELATTTWEEGREDWLHAMQPIEGAPMADRARVQAFFGRMKDLASRAGEVVIPADILEVIRADSHKIVSLARRRIELEVRLADVKPDEKQAFETGLSSLVSHLEALQARQRVLLEVRDVLEEAVELGIVPSLQMPAAVTVQQYFEVLQHRA